MAKRLLLTVVILGVVGFIALFAIASIPTKTPTLATPSALDENLAEAGRYVAVLGDCAACHTTPDGKPFAGGLAVASPVGNIYSTNITPDRDTGIGNYTLDDFSRAVRHGILPGGGTLYPAMPYPSYAKLTDADVTTLYTYFMKAVPPVHADNKPSDISWPLSMRWPLALWRRAFGPGEDDQTFRPERYASAEIARGAYLVQGPGHCGACHTPRAPTLQEEGLDERAATYLSGGPLIDGWYAGNLRSADPSGLSGTSADDLVALLSTARGGGHAVIGKPMQDVVAQSMQAMTDDDLKAIAAYLKSLPPGPKHAATFVADNTTADALKAGKESGRGAELFVDSCAACHRTNGLGAGDTFPALAGNPSVLADDPSSLIRLVLAGGAMPSTQKAPSNLGMPGFDWRMSDDEVAQVVTFIRQGWGNRASAATSAQVAKIRRALHPAGAGQDKG